MSAQLQASAAVSEAMAPRFSLQAVCEYAGWRNEGDKVYTDHSGWIAEREVMAIWDAALAAAVPARAGMALVPREPTTEMLLAGQHTKQMGIVNMAISAIEARGFAALEGLGKTGETSALAEAYRAMVAAATEPASEPEKHFADVEVLAKLGDFRLVHKDGFMFVFSETRGVLAAASTVAALIESLSTGEAA